MIDGGHQNIVKSNEKKTNVVKVRCVYHFPPLTFDCSLEARCPPDDEEEDVEDTLKDSSASKSHSCSSSSP